MSSDIVQNNEIVADNVLYNKMGYKSSHYKYVQQQPENGINSATLSTAGGQYTRFQLSSDVYNFNRFKLYGVATPAASGANTGNWMNTLGWCMVQRMSLTTSRGITIEDITDVGKLSNMIVPQKISLNKALTYDNSLAGNLYSGVSVKQNTSAGLGFDTYRPVSNTEIEKINELNYAEYSTTANAATPVVTFALDFSLLYETFFDQDKSLFLGPDNLTLTIYWHPTTVFMWRSSLVGGPPLIPTPNTAPTQYAGNVALTNLKLWMAKDTNNETINMLKSKVYSSEGMSVLYNSPLYTMLPITSTTPSVSIRFGSGDGRRLKRIYHALYNSAQSSNTAYEHMCNFGAAVASGTAYTPGATLGTNGIVSYYVMINNERTTDKNITIADKDDYMYYQQKHTGGVLLSSDEFYYNYVIDTDFTAPLSLTERENASIPFDNIEEGKSLQNGEIKYDAVFVVDASISRLHYVYAIVQKEMLINSAGITLMN